MGPLRRLKRKLGWTRWKRRPTRTRIPAHGRRYQLKGRIKAAQIKSHLRRSRRKSRLRRKQRKDGFITHVIKGLSAVKYGNRVTNAENSSTGALVRQMDSDFALFNFCPYTYDPFVTFEDWLNIGSFAGAGTANTLNIPNSAGNTGSLVVLPSLIRASSFWNMDSQVNYLASCFEEFRIKTAVIEITMPDVMEIPDTNVPTVNNNLFLMWRFIDDVKPPGPRGFMRKHMKNYENTDNWRRILPFVNGPDLDEIEAMCTEEHRNAAGSNWHRVRLTPGKSVKIKWHPKTWLRGKSGVMQQDMYATTSGTTYYSNPTPNPFGKPWSGFVDTDAIDVGSIESGLSVEDDILFNGPVFLLLDTSHEKFATYNSPELTVQSSVFQSQFKLQCKYYYKLQFRKVKRYDDNNIREGGGPGD